ncbi:MAG TPA: STAS domain-containing protein [Acetobacteraceae bacterium]|nr:STAS domain-containing protein [Acetobacteraceae bacterium]
MEIAEVRDGQTVIISLAGKLDNASAPILAEKAGALCDTGVHTILIDLQRVEYTTSAGFRALITIKRRAERDSIQLALCGLNELIRDLFDVSGLCDNFRIYQDRASALEAVGEATRPT